MIIEYADPNVATTNWRVGEKKLDKMTDAQILRLWNKSIEARDQFMAEHENVRIEIPLGKQQVKYEEIADQWVPRGHIVRARVLGAMGDEDLDEEFVTIDNRDFTIRQFVRMVGTFGGWGMRIAFVADTDLHEEPTIEIREPKSEPPPPPIKKPSRSRSRKKKA